MKQLFRKISAIFMAFVVLFSTMSFTLSEHFCGDLLVDSSLFSKAESCGMEMETAEADSDCNSIKKDCCSDEIKIFEGQSDLKVDFSSLNFEQQVFVASFTYAYINLFEGLATNIIPFKYYTPPLLVLDIHVLDQVFLI
ncbi:MAG TPA: hypothetical protein VIN72_13945 [Lutibacter sp.]